MKKFRRMMAAVVAVATMTVTVGSMAASAKEEADLAKAMLTQMEALASSADIYPHYNDYSDSLFSGSPHYLAALGKSVRGCTVNFYLTPNALTSSSSSEVGYSSSSRFSKGSNFGGLTLNVGTPTPTNDQVMRIPVTISGTINAGSYSEVIRYRVSTNNVVVQNEFDLYTYTSLNTNKGEDIFYTTNTNVTLYKCGYSLGDVDRNGEYDSTDSLYIIKYLNGKLSPDDDRDDVETALDKLAFELAADVNQDGVVTMDDVYKLNHILLGTDTFD